MTASRRRRRIRSGGGSVRREAPGAQIDVVSGATYTSQGYIQSLQAALDSAHAGGP